MRTRIIAIMLALALLLIPLSTLGVEDEGNVKQYRIGTNGRIYIDLEDMDLDKLQLNGYSYRPDILDTNRATINAGDLVTALQLAAAKDYLKQLGISDTDLFIRNGKVFLNEESKTNLSPAERVQLLDDIRAYLNTLNIDAMDLEGESLTLEDTSDHKVLFMIREVWQSPLATPTPYYDPWSIADLPAPAQLPPATPAPPATPVPPSTPTPIK